MIGHRALMALMVLASLAPMRARAQHTIKTVAGGGVPNNVPALQVGFAPGGVFKAPSGAFYIADGNGHIYKVDPSGQLTTVAGNGSFGFSGDGGPAAGAQLSGTSGVFVDNAGNIFIADEGNARIREVVAATGNIQTVAGNGTAGFSGDGGLATNAELFRPSGVFLDNAGNIFIADEGNERIRKVVATTGNIQTVAGNGTAGFSGDGGPATSAELYGPTGVFVDGSGNIFIADSANERIREVTVSTGTIRTVAGNQLGGFYGDGGPATSAGLDAPVCVFVDSSGNMFIADEFNNRIREVVAGTGVIQTIVGSGPVGLGSGLFGGDGGPAASAKLNRPSGVFVDGSGNFFIVDSFNYRIREVLAATGDIQTVAGNGSPGASGDGGPATGATLDGPVGVFTDGSGNIFIADSLNNLIREVVASTGNIQTVAGDGTAGFSGDGGPATRAQLDLPFGVFVDGPGNIFIADSNNNRIREVVASTGNIQTIAGNGTAGFGGDGGPATNATLDGPFGVFIDSSGNIFIADSGNERIREVIAATGNIQTVAGNGNSGFNGDGGPAISTSLSQPLDVFVDNSGNMFIADSGNIRIREVIAATGNIQTVAGNGNVGFNGDGGPATSADLNQPSSVFVDSLGNIFFSDSLNARIREVVAPAGNIQTVAGNGTRGFSGDGGPAASAELSAFGIWVDSLGNLIFADGSSRVRSIAGIASMAAARLSTLSVPFPGQVITGTSQPQNVTLTNGGNTTLSITGANITGTNSSDFKMTNNCGAAVAPTANCTFQITFTPAAIGSRVAALVISDNAIGGPQSIGLSGTGTDFALSTAPGGSTSATINAGQSATYNLQVNPAGGFTGAVTLTCSGAPATTTCAVPASATVTGASSATFSVQVSTIARGSLPPGLIRVVPPGSTPLLQTFLFLSLLMLLILRISEMSRDLRVRYVQLRLFVVVFLLYLAVTLAACSGGGGGGGGTPPNTYTLTITGDVQGINRSLSLTLTVN